LKIDEIVRSDFAAWIPAFAGMTDFISIQYSIDNIHFFGPARCAMKQSLSAEKKFFARLAV
jgi:hypothetical protein